MALAQAEVMLGRLSTQTPAGESTAPQGPEAMPPEILPGMRPLGGHPAGIAHMPKSAQSIATDHVQPWL